MTHTLPTEAFTTNNHPTAIRSIIERHIFTCPAHLYSLEEERLLSRNELMARVIDRIHASMPASPAARTHAAVLHAAQDLTKYAILSHRWDVDEVVYADLQRAPAQRGGGAASNSNMNTNTNSNSKFRMFCARARAYACPYAWIDTACINTDSSAELDEAVRSMFGWYRRAEVCFVYFGGGASEALAADLGGALPLYDSEPWFRRGWTLQELLAPRRVVFFDRMWRRVMPGVYDVVRCPPRNAVLDGTADFDEGSAGDTEVPQDNMIQLNDGHDDLRMEFLRKIADLSGIEFRNLLQYTPSPKHARKVFAWISKRQTTRPEDIAYCLVGLLDLQLAPAYGEGLERAFYRLQVECARRTDDRSLFLWQGSRSAWSSMLPSHPRAFGNCGTSTAGLYHRPGDVIMADALFEHRDGPLSVCDPSLDFTNCGLRIWMCVQDIRVADAVWPPAPLAEDDEAVGLGGDGARRYRVTLNKFVGDVSMRYVVTLKWKGAFPERSAVGLKWKIGVLGSIRRQSDAADGALEEVPAVILLRKDSARSPPRYQRFTSAEFERVPPLVDLTVGPSEAIFIE